MRAHLLTSCFTIAHRQDCSVDVPQLYLTDAPGEKRMRLLGFDRVELDPGQSREVTLTADPRLLARFDTGRNQWRLADGEYRVALGKSANDLVLTARTNLSGRYFGR
jgi:beta-glucosidase